MKKNNKKSQGYVNILGINVISSSASSLLTSVEDLMSHSARFYITTPGPEQVLRSLKYPQYKRALNSSNFSVPDGTGLAYASLFLWGKWLNIIHGRNLFLDLVKLAAKRGWKVFLLGGEHGEAKITESKLRSKYKRLKIQSDAGMILDGRGNPVTEEEAQKEEDSIKLINKFAPQLLFVAFGSGTPKQELWIYKNIKKLKVNCVTATGGTFRYIAGLSKLPPDFIDRLGLEWFWRLITEPHRLGRIANAVIIFPLRVFWFKVSGR